MSAISASEARRNLFRLLDAVAEEHEPVTIAGKRHNAVLVSEEDWRGIQETLYLLGVPGMRESVQEGLRTPAAEMSEEPGW
ncbi:MAG: type II toxin-antitoxin system Phd/YefM family antitoxin [Deltaproteobacteria bacterium]|nr:type II toxin-antitoxin system Phd/YefM family antitoxin [Deltaproteobacteria bacterium]